jgi:hypothetical protein
MRACTHQGVTPPVATGALELLLEAGLVLGTDTAERMLE